MTRYVLLDSTSIIGLGGLVTEHLQTGWSLYGSPVVSVCDRGKHRYYQAVTK